MNQYRVHTVESAPENSIPALRAIEQSFGFLPNIAGVMAESSVLLDAFVGVFQKVHAGSFTEAQIQTALLTNAVTNASEWPVAFHSELALRAGVSAADVAAIRERRSPSAPQLSAVSHLARALIERRGRVEEREVEAFCAAGFDQGQVLELLTIVAASTMTNYASNIAKPSLEIAFQRQAWST